MNKAKKGKNMNKAKVKEMAIEEISELMDKYTEYLDSVKNLAFDDDIRQQLKSKSDIIRWFLLGLESGYYES